LNSDFDPLKGTGSLIVYFDIKSPYAFVAKDPTYALVDELGIDIDWRPLTLDIPSYLGSARLDKKGEVAASNRSKEQWGGVRYAYMDARRYASAWGYGLRGTEKIWDTSLVHIAFSWVKRSAPGALRTFLDLAYPRFWLRDLDVEDLQVVIALIDACGASSDGFEDWAAGDGRAEHDEQQAAIFAAGIYGVPGYVYAGAYYFGREHLPHLRQLMLGEPAGGVDIGYSLPAPEQLEKLQDGKHLVFLGMLEAARSNSLAIIAGVNGECVQSRLALKTIEELQRDYPQQLSVRFGQVSAQKPKTQQSVAAEALDPGEAPTDIPLHNRGTAHRDIRARYELADSQRYETWRGVEDLASIKKRDTVVTIDPAATKLLESVGLSQSFGFAFVDQNNLTHLFKGRAHLHTLRWALEHAQKNG